MDKINFIAADNFPASSDTLELLQQMINSSAGLARLGGTDYILSGCADDGNGNVGAGLIVINGEILPFEAGVKKAKITIRQTSKTLTAFGVEYPEAYIYRTAGFSDTGEYAWSGFAPVSTNGELLDMIRKIQGDAPGTVKMWAGQVSKIPSGFMLCNGDELQVADYPELFNALGSVFGGNGSNTFGLPDLRGRFVAGYNNAQSDYSAMGKKGGNDKVTLTADQMPAHNHAGGEVYNKLSARAADVASPGTTSGVDARSPEAEYNIAGMTPPEWMQATIKSVGGGEAHENRPPYFVLAYIIKVK
ncbi:MAG: tail fiber protein [Tannerella sp.]|jgi:microcystin-dependent protein|nr:tail fiber protein [Tannerella sp.]